jgi:uncharacterized protein (TIGR02145 family)
MMKVDPGLILLKTAKVIAALLLMCTLFHCNKWDLDRSNPNDPESDNHKPRLPVLTTTSPSEVTRSSVITGGNITDNGSGEIIARGVCWAKTENPDLTDNKTTDGPGTGNFISSISGLEPGTTYFVRAYATNSAGTAYGTQVSFNTLPYTVTDIDGNVYNTVKIGTQIWMAENLKTTRYRDGTNIPYITDKTDWTGQTTGAYCWDKNDISSKDIYGALYNWYAAVDGHYLCPAGWHVPTDDEWTILTNSVGGEATAGTELKEAGSAHWNTGVNGNNSSGFTALPGGIRWNGDFGYIGKEGDWWTSTINGTESAWRRVMNYTSSNVIRDDIMNLSSGLSIRCMEGEGKVLPLLTTAEAGSTTRTTLTSGGNILNNGGTEIINIGVCWGTSPNTSINVDNHTVLEGGPGSFSSTLTGLYINTTYYMRAYATNSVGTGYGNEISFVLWLNVSGEGVADLDGNTYKTVKIGLQEWMAENLKTTKYGDGLSIANVTDNAAWAGLTSAAYCWYNNDIVSNKSRYGAMYNFYAINTGKLCPRGWHVPSDDEWHALVYFLDPSSTLTQNESLTAGGKLKETGTIYWYEPNEGATNESGFNARPGGGRYVTVGQFFSIQSYGEWWTSTLPYTRTLSYDNTTVFRGTFAQPDHGFSVRCMKD